MRWIKSRKDDSHKALADAETHVEEAKSRNPEVYTVSGSLRRLREENHFAEQIYLIMVGERGGRQS